MGCRWSSTIKAEGPSPGGSSPAGKKSRRCKRGGNGSSGGGSSKVSSASIPLTPRRSEGEILQSSNLRSFSFYDLKMATRNFRPDSMVGEGGFGSVFKGWINENNFTAARPGTGIVIAVKRLNYDGLQGHKEWFAEVNYLSQFQHPNLVKLLGYCLEEDHHLLVYEFVSRGSLDNHLFRRGSYYQPLSWSLRVRIALGAARGLAFLHNGETKVIYRDFKSSNVLLDSNYEAKLSDFGLATDGPMGSQTHVTTRRVGTHGYAAPEYLASGHLSVRSDVYSYGVVLLEMLCGRPALDNNRPGCEQNLVEWARPYINSRRGLSRVIDARLEGQYSHRGAQSVVALALRCLCPEPKRRPTMLEIVNDLEQLQDTAGNVRTDASNPQPARNGNERRPRRPPRGEATPVAGNVGHPGPPASRRKFHLRKRDERRRSASAEER